MEGHIKLDNLHSDYLILTKEKFKEVKSSFHPFIRDFVESGFNSN